MGDPYDPMDMYDNEVPTWRELEAKYQRQSFRALITATAAYAALVLCLVFDVGPPTTVVLVIVSSGAQALTFWSMDQEHKCRNNARREEMRNARAE